MPESERDWTVERAKAKWAREWFENLPISKVTLSIVEQQDYPSLMIVETIQGEHEIEGDHIVAELDRLVKVAWNDGYKNGDDDGFREGRCHA